MNALVVLPTYNEASNITNIITRLLDYQFLNVLVVDDNSEDGTARLVRDSMQKTDRVHLIEREGKLGLGTAYVTGFKWGLQRGYDLYFEMDADNSHNPAAIPYFIKEIEKGNDIVVGSRYLYNTISVVGWDFKRLLMSKFGNWYASRLLGLKQFTDLTSGFRCYTREALIKIDLEKVKSNGYSFQIEMVYRACRAHLRVAEMPIIFYVRNSGSSKMSRKIMREAVFLPFKLMIEQIIQR